MKELLDKLDLYEISWVPYDKVIKMKNNDNTILIKHHNRWEWYNKKYFDNINCDIKYKNELIKLLLPINGDIEI